MRRSNQAVAADVSVNEELESVSTSEQTELLPEARTYAGIFCISGAVLLFELALTRIFSVMLFSNLAFMVVSTALFGFGLSGVYLALRPEGKSSQRGDLLSSVPGYCLAAALSMIASFLVVSYVPFKMWEFDINAWNYAYLAIWEMSLVVPFFFAGLAIATLLSSYPRRVGRLYGFDLIGAATGSLSLIFVITWVGGQGVLVLSSLLAVFAGFLFSSQEHKTLRALAVLTTVILVWLLPNTESYLPIQFHQRKRNYGVDENEKFLDTRWSSLSKVDIAEETSDSGPLKGRETRAIWIDAGTNGSVMLKVDGNAETMPPQTWLNIAAPYYLKRNDSPRAIIIGSSGGREVLFGLSNGASHIDAVEMDPSIVHFVNKPEYAAYSGNVYHNSKTTLINDEGRAFLKRTPLESYDIIESVNNYTPIAMASGALNLSETFLFTKEAFHDYLDHLRPNGVVALFRGATLRVALTAAEALRERGIEHPENHILIANGDYEAHQAFLLKKSEWTEEEIATMYDFFSKLPHYGKDIFLWSPKGDYNLDPIYRKVIRSTAEDPSKWYTKLGVNLTPATDNWPFIEHYLFFGDQDLAKGTPPEFKRRESQKWNGVIPRGDFPYVAILGESAILALLFVGMPLFIWARDSRRTEGFLGFVGFFASLGFSFIVIEICLMKRYVLFLGHPAYSITTILVTLLCGAGIGSLLSERFAEQNPRKSLTVAMGLLALCLVGEMLISPLLFSRFLGVELLGRFAITACMLLPLGICMGMPFSLGISLIHQLHKDETIRRKLVAWAWGINGYTTVIGSAGTVFIALAFGFQNALLIATIGYLLGLASIRVATRRLG